MITMLVHKFRLESQESFQMLMCCWRHNMAVEPFQNIKSYCWDCLTNVSLKVFKFSQNCIYTLTAVVMPLERVELIIIIM